MNNPVSYFEIPVSDLGRAIMFYSAVFGYEMERAEIDGNMMALFPFAESQSGITGALAQGDSYVPGQAGARLYFRIDNIDETLQRAETAGGRIVYPKTDVGENGWVAEFEDSEGNCIALNQI